MTTLYLIRHGKASASDEDYDKLRPLGEAQARMLGSYLAHAGKHFDSIFCGPLKRQVDTLGLMREAAGELGSGWPAAVNLDSLAEAPFELLLKSCMTERLETDPVIRDAVASMRAAKDRESMRPSFEIMFDHMIGLWRRDEVAREDLELAKDFDARVQNALDGIVGAVGEGQEVAVVTSNGVISRMLEFIERPGLPSETHLSQFANTSVTQILFAGGEWTVGPRNLTDHIDDPSQVTYL